MGLDAQILADAYSQEELEALRTVVAKEVVSGKTVTAWTMGDSSAQKMPYLSMTPRDRAKLIYAALVIKDPDKYSPNNFTAIDQTRVEFLDLNRCY